MPVLEEVRGVLSLFEDYVHYAATFHPEAALATPQGGAGAAPQGEAEVEQQVESAAENDINGIVEGLKQPMSRVGCACLDFLVDVFEGTHDAALKALATTVGCASGIQWSNVAGDIGTALYELVRLLGLHKQVVGLDGEAPPPPGTRQLRRYASEEGKDTSRREQIARERQDVWNRAQQMRRKFANVAVSRYASHTDLQRFFETKCAAAYNFVGKPGEAPVLAPNLTSLAWAHRVYAFRNPGLCHAMFSQCVSAMLAPLFWLCFLPRLGHAGPSPLARRRQ